MNRSKALLGLLLLLGLSAVAAWLYPDPPETALVADIRGARARTTDGEALFDRDRLPVITVDSSARLDEPVAVTWHGGGETARARVETTAHRRGRIVRVEGWSDEPAKGPGELRARIGSATAAWRVRWIPPPEELPGLATVISLRKAGRPDDALRDLAGLDVTAFDLALWAGVERARLVQATGTPTETIDAWTDAAAEARRLGVVTEVARRYRAAAFTAWRHRRAAAMAELLDAAAAFNRPKLDPDGNARMSYMRGQLAQLVGDWRGALTHLRTAMEQFDELGDEHAAGVAAEMLSVTLSDLGDASGALDALATARTRLRSADPDIRGRLTVNLSWLTLRALPDDPTAAQKTALRERLDEGRAAMARLGNRLDTANAAVNQAWGALELGDLDIAETRLEEARLLDPDEAGYAAPYATLLQARVDLARARLDAADAGFRRLEARARDEQGETSELRWRALFGRGRVARARGDIDDARAHFDAALVIVDALGRRAALRGDRATFHADRSDLVDEAIDLTVEREPWRAFGYADAARARPMRALQADLRVGALDEAARRRWAEALDAARAAAETAREARAKLKLAPVAEEPARRREAEAADAAREAAFDSAYAILDTATPAPGGVDGRALSRLLAADEVLFAFHGRWAFRVDGAGTTARPLSPDPAADPLGDWRDLPPAVEHVYIVPGGHPQAFGLATDGKTPLLEQVSVSFVPYAGLLDRALDPPAGPPLVVADPRRDLSHAAAEGRLVAGALPDGRLLSGGMAARATVLTQLAEARLFHFAGHGILNPEQPWDAHLRLAGDDILSLSDVLTHPMAPAVVVLSGCETGVDDVLLDEAVVGLPEAFLAAGAGAVLATDREVDDRATRRFIERFYAEDGAERPARALRRAALAARDDGDPAWQAFRLIGLRRPLAPRGPAPAPAPPE